MVLAMELPQISISLAPPEEPIVEPFSPFSWVKASINDDDGFRSTHLTPPPTHLRFSPNLPSPLGPVNDKARGLERDRFEALLKATRERNAYSGGQKDGDLRKEIALKAHKNKQVERRALFLSKVLAPPSPTAVSQPVTPPDSPALFHFRFPSPGLVSPLALFESLNEDSPTGPLSYPIDPWVEQVDYRLPHQKAAASNKIKATKYTNHKKLPSLEEITARLGPNHVRISSSESNGRTTRLPGFLAQRQGPAPTSERPRLSLGVGRLQAPIRAPQPSKAEQVAVLPPPKSPSSPLTPKLQVTTILVPRSSSLSPTELNESNLNALQSRERKSKDMLSTLRRRVIPSDSGAVQDSDQQPLVDRRWKRHSAPADIAPRPRAGFEHPVLSMKGAF
ncbi:hypothetical protein EV361DRAFT_842698 [Lentinula raphanica]|uniref:Uncharacterized protein n=1 Tax=Lentinula raphanica TaxID=153919 RepID=A0AA38P9G8_9AGAR|nr:hypothetical protein F5880DRAFT_1540725 [Lentinula raphanica]KAJ3838543.1 hypothetical protein F5878DRAFT_562231 [Lentinula raphanica]KAJ3973962.1 hypothetical protein EV361DRAFT_842698 [Lentinula raphanica]